MLEVVTRHTRRATNNMKHEQGMNSRKYNPETLLPMNAHPSIRLSFACAIAHAGYFLGALR
jgi:hypothetical protein